MSPAAAFIEETISNNLVVIFSKSYCPFCKRAKALFDELEVPYVAVELNTRADGDEIQDLLEQMTGASTVPRVFVNKKCLGGASDVEDMHSAGVHVDRSPEGANFVPRDRFRGPVFPPYCEGDAFIMHGSKLAWLYAASLYTDHYALFPHYVTGHMAAIAEMGHVNISRLVGVADHVSNHGHGRSRAESRRRRCPGEYLEERLAPLSTTRLAVAGLEKKT
ncbi:hypothetical protein HPB48_010090 [Haemaphysalis longicornis]|uniref:Glutaredoxin-2, mitochondrial n=1 Tax=Haemaphysalis longicornis TaxID=44386 RepID=A0A9J6FY74_HAELO|nr:hypothetical protein HPB48_010090 [Haemaphysalis longicornis]